ncbi:MAG: TolC family protein [Planctomycetota bacterium]
MIQSNQPAASRSRIGRRFKLAARRVAIGTLIATQLTGCGLFRHLPPGPHDSHVSYHDDTALDIEYPQAKECPTPESNPAAVAAELAIEPLALEDPAQLPTFDLTLQQAIQMALTDSPVLRSIGGSVVSAPAGATTIYEPGITAASLTQGTEGALSAFDAEFTQQLFWTNTDQPANREPFDIPNSPLVVPSFSKSRGATYISELSKQTATGARFALRHNVTYSKTQDPSVTQQLFPSSFIGWVEAEWRQPLMQGGGTLYNQIVGPVQGTGTNYQQPGQYNGVLIARVNEDVALADFEAAVITLVADVEQSYWNLANAYRSLEATLRGRQSAQQTFQFQEVRLEVGTGRQDEEAQARSQFFQFQAQVDEALAGQQGLYTLEQQLRYLVGLPASDGRLIKPTTDPLDIKVTYDWRSSLGEALTRRVEVRRQKFNLRRRELELTAARLNFQPRLDFLAQYRWRGLGDHLIGNDSTPALDNLYGTISSGDFQEAQAGIELGFPVGFRAAGLAISEAKLNLRREQALLAETELQVSHDLASAARQTELSFRLVETNYQRFLADLRQVEVLRRRYRDGSDNINFLLQAQQQVVTSEIAFYQALFNYNTAIRDFHRQKGSLLAYNQVTLSEAAWDAKAYQDAHTVGRYLEPRPNPSKVKRTPRISRGSFNPSEVQPSYAPAVMNEELIEVSSDALPPELEAPASVSESIEMVAPQADEASDFSTPMPIVRVARVPGQMSESESTGVVVESY